MALAEMAPCLLDLEKLMVSLSLLPLDDEGISLKKLLYLTSGKHEWPYNQQ